MQSVIIGKNQAGQRLDKFLHKYLPLAGKGFLYKMLRKKNITLNGKRAEGGEILAQKDEVKFFFSDETFSKFSGRISVTAPEKQKADGEDGTDNPGKPSKRVPNSSRTAEYEKAFRILKGITVLYEDEDCLILNKPSGILSQKASSDDLSLNEWMIGYLLSQNHISAEELTLFHPSVCNRLDRNTSGIVLCGKSLCGLQYLSEGIRERRIRKFYRTICVGSIREAGESEGYLVKDRSCNRVAVSHPSGESGFREKAAFIKTAYKPLQVTDAHTLLEVELITGKSHQIRAHLAEMGHPLIGDCKYGQESINRILRQKYGLKTQLLHSCTVTFPGNDSGPGKALGGKQISAPYPELFKRLERELFPSRPPGEKREIQCRKREDRTGTERYGYMEFQGTERFHTGGYDQPDK